MTGEQERMVRALMEELCTSADPASFARRWGRTEPSRQRPGGLRVVCEPGCPFASLEVRPWGEDVTGVVDVELRAGDRAPAWSTLRDRFGPFTELPRLHGPTREYGARWSVPGAAAEAAVFVGVTDGTVTDITLRRDPL